MIQPKPIYAPIHVHSHFSLLDGLSKPSQIAERCKEIGVTSCAVTEHGNISSFPNFLKECKKLGIKPIAGCEFYVSEQDATIKEKDNKTYHLVVLAKNIQGWKNLMKASSASFRPEFSYRKPRLDLERLASYSEGNFITFSGHMGSHLANVCFAEYKLAYSARTYEEARKLVHPDWQKRVTDEIERHQKLFGKENFYLEIQLVDQKNLPASLVVARILRHCGKLTGTPCVATADSHYPRREDAADQRILLCSALDTTMKEVQRKLDADEDVGLGAFFRSNNYHIPSQKEMQELHADHPDELSNSLKIAEQCEIYDVGGKPLFPQYICPDKKTPDEYLMELCLKGWKEKIENKVSKSKHAEYRARLDEEYKVLTEAGLSSYFLITQDFVRYATDTLKVKVGKGRGSAAGCFISYLIGITRVDPIRFGLMFARFYNAGRNSPGKISLPDIDTDFPIASRDKIIEYCRNKFGKEYVCQMATFSRMQGRGALKDVLRAHERCSFEEMNRITEHIPDEAAIADELQEMKEETGEASIIRWALENNPDQLKEWCVLKDNGELEGPLSLDFAQAIRLEGTKRNMGKHASGLIICSEVLADIAPMVYDKSSEEMIVGIDMRDSESIGLVKVDILGLVALDKLQGAENIIKTGKL